MAYGAFEHGKTNGRTSTRAAEDSRRGHTPLDRSPFVEAFLISLSTVAIAEMGDRTQLLALVLAAHYRRPWPIIAGVLCATLVNHAVAGYVGAHLGRYLTPGRLNAVIGISMVGMALWTLKPDKLDEDEAAPRRASAFIATCIAFFIAEIGDKTQIATMALGAAYPNLFDVVSGTTLGMLAANVPVVFLGNAFSKRLPLRAIHIGASLLFLALGVLFIWRAFRSGL
jgi:putative Ca2+/H+ antiporter (TMEM165/GDT1 family)